MILMIKNFLNTFYGTIASLKVPDSTVSDNFEEKEKSQAWNKSSDLYLNILKIDVKLNKEEVGKRWKKESSGTNNSTLSLNITAYENSIEAVSNQFNDKNVEDIGKEKFGTAKPTVSASTILIQNPFEFPRQQNNTVPQPEVSQFKASQQLATPTKVSDKKQAEKKVVNRRGLIMEDSLNNIICPVDSEWKFNKEVLKCLKDNGGLNGKCYYAFNIPGLQYYVNIHPNGCSEDTRGHTLIFFHVNGSNGRKVDANVTIAIKSTRYSKILIHGYESNIGRIGFWCEASDFFDSESKYFVNDTVTVKVKGTLKAEQLLIPKIVSPILIQWKINENDLKAKQHDASKGYLRSAKVDVVQFSDVQYFLSIYPYRIKEGKQLQECLYFGVELKNEKKIEAVYDFSVDSVSFNSGHQYFFEKTHSRGTTLCLSDDLFDSSKKYFVDGILTITLNGILMKESVKKFIELPCIGLITKEDEEKNNKDFTIIVAEKSIKVHKQVLKDASPALAGMLGSEMKESIENQIVIKDFEFKTVDVAIKLLYNINIFRRLSIEDILSLYKFANTYEIHRITDIAEDYLFKEISPSNIVQIFLFFKDVRVPRLREKCVDRLIQYHKESVAVYSLESLDKYLLFVSILSNSWHRIVYTDTTST